MSESDGEQAARSVALEQAYVHEVYEQCAEKTAQSRHWPRIYQFLEELEPGALVCDVGCGNGKYLSVNQSIFKVGVDRCRRLTDIAREKENEVLICDNLALPFRDDSFDAVLSIAVVHHFATTERRVHALKELARVLRIGGKLVISVWAMEQRHRKFQSQDVLVPWPKAYCLSSTSNGIRPSGIPYADEIQHNQISHKDLLTSKRASQKKYRNKSYWIDPVFSPSPSTSSLSSPNETCYSFVRRALQKLAGGKRGGPGSRPWFLETWHNGAGKERRHLQHDDSGDVDDLPIELRRLEDINVTMNKFPDTLSVKSKSLGDILEVQRLDLVRSRSSIPGLCSTLNSDSFLDEQSKTPPLSSSKPRLVKQKSYFIDDITLDIPENTAIQELIKDLPDFQTAPRIPGRRGNVHKQSSMNEELMSIERLKEKEKVRRNIMKQASLNEEIICKRKAFEAFKDSLYSGNATKRFQLLKSGLTNKIKQSTTNIEKVSGMSIKNGFVRMLQGWKSVDTPISASSTMNCDDPISPIIKTSDKLGSAVKRDGADCIERRLSREDGSDSSKDSSLQSDTSVDSEDSFASVIYVPKPEMSSIIDVIATAPPGYQISTASAPPSPRVKHPPDFSGPRLKLIPVSPLSKQFPATSKSLPPTSPPGLSPRTLNSIPGRLFFSSFSSSNEQAPIFDKFIRPKESESNFLKSNQAVKSPVPKCPAASSDGCNTSKLEELKPALQPVTGNEAKGSGAKATNMEEVVSTEETVHVPVVKEILPPVQEKPVEKSSTESINEEENRKARLNQIKELLKQKPGFATRCAKPSFPLVRRASAATPGRLETVARPLPRLLSLELFNPETDDLDSDSSGVSSPESVGSVISVISDERFIVKKDNSKAEENGKGTSDRVNGKLNDSGSTTTDFSHSDDIKYESLASGSQDGSSPEISSASSQSIRLLEAAANVASSLEDAVETAIQLKPHGNSFSARTQRHINKDGSSSFGSSWRNSASPTELQQLLDDSKQSSKCFSLEEKTWNEECRQHLIDFTEKLSENLIHDIDQYCQKTELEFNDDFTSKNATTDLFKSNTQSQVADAFVIESMAPPYVPGTLLTEASESCKYSELVDTIAWLNKSTNGSADPEIDNKPSNRALGLECSIADINSQNVINNVLMHRSRSEDIMDFVLVSNNGEFINDEEIVSKDGRPVETTLPRGDLGQGDITGEPYLRFGNSIESSDIGDSIENTTSFSECSQTESFRESITAEKTDNGSTASLGSMDMECSTDRKAESKPQTHTIRSGLKEAASPGPVMNEEASGKSECNGTLSESSSQESLPSDHGGGAITYHQYYHVFREGELDQLINKYVENLHIISSYYDHASWCIVAEKVQVWTI